MSNIDQSEVLDVAQAPGLLDAMTRAGLEILDGAETPLFNAESIAAAVVDRRGRVVCASPAFAALRGEAHLDADALALAARGAGTTTSIVEVEADGAPSDSAIFAYALASQARAWSLPPAVAAAAEAHRDHVVVLTSLAARTTKPLEDAARAYGLTGLQTRVALATIRTGSIRAAAARLAITYGAARDALSEALARTGATRLPGLVSRLTSVAFGVLPTTNSADVLGDLWGLSARQAEIASLVADGLSRAEAAAALGLSEAVVKKELDRVYLILQAGSGAALARKLVEATALRWLTRATGGDAGFVDAGSEPLQFLPRPGGGRISFSDYGPCSGKPVLVVHSSMTTRLVARGLRRALQAAGYRPIAIDRPGFGLCDEIEGARPGADDCWATAMADALLVLDALKLATVDVVARGGAQFVMALAGAAPQRVGRVVLVNPDPPISYSGEGRGYWQLMKAAHLVNPGTIRLSIRLMMQQFTFERHFAVLQRTTRGSAPDEAVLRDDPDVGVDYFRAQRALATGRFGGVVNEQIDITRALSPPPMPGTIGWTVLVGAHDNMHDADKVLAYWREVLPDADLRCVEDAGRLLSMSHPQVVVDALAGA